MIRKLSILGVALTAVLALTAVAASTASATGKVTCVATSGSPYPCTLTGESPVGNDKFTTEGGVVECKSHFHATIGEATSTLTVAPTYTGCKAFGFVEAQVHVNGCGYQFTTPTNIGPDEWTSGGTLSTEVTHLVCPVGKAIEITAATCRVVIDPQTLTGHLVITNTTTAADKDGTIDVQATYEKITYTVTQDGFGCPFNGTGTKHDATYKQGEEVKISAAGKDVHVG